MVDARILGSKWVEPKGGNQYGHKLKAGAPESVKKQFEQYQSALKAVHAAATGGKWK